MRIELHEDVAADVLEAKDFYERISTRLSQDFEGELRASFEKAAEEPFWCHPCGEFRRVNLKRFPYHFLFSVHSDFIRIMVVRHNKRHPDHGLNRAD